MTFFKKNLLTLIFLALIYGAFFVSQVLTPKPTSLNVLGADTNTSLFVEPSAGRKPILDAINNAKSEILVEVYLLSDKQIIQGLEDAKTRGVKVNVMLEQHPFGGGNLNNSSKKTLEENGVSVEWTNSAFSLTHEKSIVIDQNEAFILNQNLTASAFSKNREYDVLDTDFQDVSQIREMFIDDWERKSFTPSTSHLIVSPTNSRPALRALIESGTKTVDLEVEIIEDSQIASLLSEKAKHTRVRLLIPAFSQIQSNAKAAKELANAGVLVKTLSAPYIHAKLILVDNQKAYVGSVNLSTQSMDQNRELGIILSQKEASETLSSTFEEDWNRGRDFNQNSSN
ncbi:MAG: phospholipase D-like domain-containing protein [Patescibacteria group bacterium]|nr:phospholipase D-like domain-containing protein [Patescibacteria group bacterium]